MTDLPVAALADAPVDSDERCSVAIDRIGLLIRELGKIETRKSQAVAAATTAAETAATPLLGEKAALEAKVAAWCTAERDRLTRDGETKTVEFATGEVSWRKGRPSVEFDRSRAEAILLALRKIPGYFARFTNQPPAQLSKSKMLAATDKEKEKLGKIRGVSFVDGVEAFSIAPVGAALADRPEAAEADAG